MGDFNDDCVRKDPSFFFHKERRAFGNFDFVLSLNMSTGHL